MRWVVASGLFSCVLVAGMLALGGVDTSPSSMRSSASAKFLTRALGETRPGAPLLRRPTPGVRVRLDRSGFRVSGRGATISLASPHGRSWSRFAGGVTRPTSFGRQTILVNHAKAEEFLTVARRQGTKTWRWRLSAGDLEPRLGDDGAIGFVDGHSLASLHIEPVAILDRDGAKVTPDDLRWSLERRGGAWLLALRLDDSELPLPYVIDPAIAFRSATTAVNNSTAFITINKPAGVVQDDLLLAHMNFESGSDITITPPAGWTLVRRTNNVTDIGQASYRKVAGASEPASYTFNFNLAKKASAGMSAYTYISTTSPVNVSGGATGNSATPTAPSITTTVTNTMLVALFGNKKASTYTPPAGMTERYDVANTASGMPSSEAADQAQAAAGASGTRQATSSDPEAWVAQLVALTPAADTNPPAAPVQSISESSADSHQSGSTFYYRPAGAGGTFTVTSTTSDGESGVQKVNFPGLLGGFTPLTGYDHTTSPYSRTYTWPTTIGTESGAKTVTAYDNANNTSTGTFTITPDSAAPPLPVTTFPAAASYNAAGWNAGCGTNGFCGTSAADATSGLQQVELSIRRDSTGLYWNGASFASGAESFRLATGTSSWSLTFPASSFPADGTYTIRVRATDNVGNAATTATLTFTYDTANPTGSLTAPAAGSNVRSTISVDSNSADTGGSGVASAQFQRSPAGADTWTNIGAADTTSPYSVSFDTTAVSDGLYDLRVITLDNAGNSLTSAVVDNVRVDNTNPTGAVTAPAAGANVRGTISVDSNSADTGGSGVASAQLQRSPAGAGTWTNIGAADTTSPYSASFDTTAVSDGLYDLRAMTLDNAGNSLTSAVVANVRVDNTNPTGSVTAPAAGANVRQTITVSSDSLDSGGSGVASARFERSPAGAGTWTEIGTDSGGTPWEVSFDTTAVIDGLYDLRVITTDAAGNQVTSGVVANVRVDNTNPSALFGFPASSTAYAASAWDAGCAAAGFCGTQSDGGSGVQQVEVSIQRVSNGLYWSAGSFSSATEVYETASLAGSDWSLAFAWGNFPADGDYVVHARARDAANNMEAGPSRTFTYDNSAPSVPALSYGSLQNAVLAGGVVWYRPFAGNGQFEVTASSSDPHSGVASYSFPAAASGWSVSGSGAARTYSHSGSPTDPSEPNNVTATNGANLTSGPASFTVSPDSTAPAGQTISLNGGPFYATQSVAFTTGDGSDGESGLDTASRLLERADADLTNGSCGAFGSYGGSYTSPDTSVADDKCYRYRFSIADRVGNRSNWVESAEAKVDTSAPATPGLTVTETAADPDHEVVGQILYYRPGANGGSFTVSASAADAQSGIKHVSFPAVAAVAGGGVDDSLAPYEQVYTWSALTNADTAASVTATNNASSTSGAASFEVRPDSTAPTSAIQCDSGACSAGWYVATASVSLSAGDAGAGVSEIRYTTDGSDPSPVNGTVYSAPFDVASTTTVRFRAYDRVGNEELVGQQLIRIDTVAPTTTAAAANTSGSVHWNGSGTVFYRPGGSGGFDLTATVTDSDSGPQKANFPAIAGFGAGGDDTTVPYSSSYSYSGTPTEPGAKVVTGYDNVNRTSTATVSITADSTAPSGHSATIAGGYYTALSVAVTLDNGSDAGAGVNPASAVLEREEAPLDNGDGSCDSFPGSWTQVTLSGGADTSVQNGRCYRYRYTLSDRVGNVATSGVSAIAKVDTSAPSATMNNPGNPLQGVITLSAGASDAGSGTNNATFQYKRSSGSTWSSAGADSSSPYSISWDTMSVADGRYDFRVIVTDVAGNSTTSASVNNRQITNNPPIVSITAPGDYVNAADPDPYTITATASAEWPKTVDQVEFFRCTNASAGCATGSWVSLGVDLSAPYSASWALDADGLRSLRAEVEDNAHSTNSDILDVTIDRTPPGSQTIGLNGGPWFAAASVGFTTGDGTDGGSGIDTASRLVERAEATLTNGACGTFGAFGGSFVSPDATVASGNCYRYRFSVADNAGNRSAWVESADAKVDASAPSTPALTVAESPADPDQHVTGSTVYYRPGGGRAGSFAVSATTSDDQSGIQRVAFPAVAGMTGGGDDLASPYQGNYDWTETTGTSGSQPVSSQNGAGISGAASSFTVTPDSTAPSGQTAALVGGPYFTSASLSFTTGNGSDSGANLDLSSVSVERAEAALVDGTCDPLGAFSGSYSSPDTSVVSGSCYRYRFSIADNVGNRAAWVETATAKIDTSAPAAPSLSFGSFTSASATGSTVYYRPSAGGGQFTVTATATDGQSGVASYGFPSAATGWTVSGSGASRTYSHSGSPTDPAEPNDVTAQNNAGLTSSATSFDVAPDSTSPTGQSISAPAYATTTSVAFTTADGTDTGSGLDTSTRLIRRAESSLSNDTCDPFGSPSGSFTSPDTTVTSGHCYLYELTIADKVGNVSTPVTVAVKVDTSAPAAPSLSYGSFSNAVLSGGVVFYRPSAAAGQFAVTAGSSDTETGVASYTFPSAPAGWSRSVAGTTATYSHSGSPTDPAEPNDVTATNNAGLESGATSFTADADGSAPVSSIQCNDVACGGWYGGPVEIELVASDTGSGLAEIRYTTDGTDPTTTHGTVYSGEFDVSVATEIRYRAFDRLGNAEAVRSQQIMFDTSGPSVPALTLAEAPADPDQHVSGTTLYYRPGGGRSGTFSVLATTGDPQSGIERVTFPAITGMTGEGDDLVSPYEATYDWSSGVSASGANTVTARNNAGLQSNSSFAVTPDSGPPTGQSVDLAGGPYFRSLSVPLSLDNGSDAASGLDLSSGVVERQAATLSAGNCVAWSGAWTPVALVGGADTTVLTNQCYRYRYLIADNLGNQSGPSALSAEAKVDATAPVTADDAPAGWESSAVVVTLGVNEIGSGVASTEYRVDGGSFQNGTSVSVPAPADHSNDGVHTVDYRSTDVAGNLEALRTTTVRIDTTLPTTVDDAPAGWRNSAVSVTLTPNDALSGIGSTEYRVDGGSFQNGTSVSVPAPADHSNDGVHTVDYRSTDVAGNVEALRTATVRVDTTLPTGSIDSPGNLAHVNGIVGVSALAADTASGVAAVEFRVRPNGSGSFSTLSTDSSAPFQASWDSTSAPEGNTELQILVTDNAVNVLATGIVTVVVDNPPAVSLVDPGANVAGTVNLEATSSPDTNLVVFERSPQGAGTWTVIATDLTAPFVAAFDSRAVSDTSYDFRAVATDLAGFTGSSNLRTARVDNTAPTVSVSDPANDAVVGGPNVHVGALASDLGSGVGSVRFEARAAAVGTFTEIGTDLAPPFDATWNASALAGSYELRAVATDAVGNPATSASILVTVDSIAPSVTLADVGTAVRGVVTLSAATQGAAVANVVFRWKPSSGDSWTEIGTDTAGPWNASFDTKNVPDGLYDLRAQAADSAGNVLAAHTRENVRIDNTAPSLQSAVPANGSSVARASAIVLFASEPVAAVRGATLDGAATTPEIAGSRITFATGSLGLGRHELAGSLEDAVGNAATFQIAFVVKVHAQAALVLSVGKPRSSVRGKQQIFVVQLTLSKPAKVVTTLLSPTGRRVRTTRGQLPAGRNQVKIAVPRDSLPPGRYTIVVRATSADGTEVVKRVRVMVKGAQHTKQQSPSPAPRGALVPTPQAEGPPPPPQPARRPVEPGAKRPDPTPRPGSKPEDEVEANTLEAASRLVKSKDRHNLGLGIFLLVMGLAVAYLLKMELRRLVAGPRRFGG